MIVPPNFRWAMIGHVNAFPDQSGSGLILTLSRLVGAHLCEIGSTFVNTAVRST